MDRPLPNYFLIDLPGEHPVSPQVISEACHSLRRNRRHYLEKKTSSAIIRLLSELGEAWQQPDFPFRQRALREGPTALGFSQEVLAEGLDRFFRQLTVESLQALVQQDLGSLQRLDGFSQSHTEIQERRSSWARGPELIAHITAGNLPNPALTSMILGLLTRSAQLIKCPRGGALVPQLFAHSLYDMEPKLASCLELAYWPGGSEPHDDVLFREADLVTFTGSDAALEKVRQRLPSRTRLLGYGHRVSFGFITSGVLGGYGVRKVIQRAADDVIAWDQQGCLSPHLFYVQLLGAMSPEQFAEQLANELARRETAFPRAALSVEEAAAIQSRREFYGVRASHNNETKLWSSEGSTAWTVVYETSGLFQLSCLNRFVHVKAVASLDEALKQAESIRENVSTVALAANTDEAPELAQNLARWGATRVCSVGSMQHPPLTWRHDGRPALADLVQWTDWEQ